jgi:hypothetical protein
LIIQSVRISCCNDVAAFCPVIVRHSSSAPIQAYTL